MYVGWNPSLNIRTTCCRPSLHLFSTIHCNFLVATDILYLQSLLIERSLLYNGYRVFPGGKERPRRDADSSLPSSAVGHERIELYLYCPYGLYGLYRASVPVQGVQSTYLLPYSLTGLCICFTIWPTICFCTLNCTFTQMIVHISVSIVPSGFLNLLKPTGYVMPHQFNIQQLYALPTPYLCVLYLSENKQRLVPLTA